MTDSVRRRAPHEVHWLTTPITAIYLLLLRRCEILPIATRNVSA